MTEIEKVILDQHKYEVCCSRCGQSFWSIVEILDVTPLICGNCNINMPVKYYHNGECIEDAEQII